MTTPAQTPPPDLGRYAALFTLPESERLAAFAAMGDLYPTRTIRRGPAVRELVPGDPVDVAWTLDGRRAGIADFIAGYRATGLLILHRDRVVCERYAQGSSAATRWISFSMAKSITSTLVGCALHDGAIASLDDPVTRTVPALAGSAYDGVSIRQVLQMSSGVRWIETYLDPESDRRRLLAMQRSGRPGVVIDYLSRLPRDAQPGTRFNYNTGETFLLGAILAGAIGRPLADYLSQKIWQPCGMECDAYWQLESPNGLEFAGSGISATLRDYARFGRFVLGDGVVDSRRSLPPGWMAAATAVEPGTRLAPGAVAGYEPRGYGYQWWTYPASATGGRIFGALGIYGQQIWIDVDRELVIAVNGAWPEPVHAPSLQMSVGFFGAVSQALADR